MQADHNLNELYKNNFAKIHSSYGPLAYFSDIFISGKKGAISA